MELLTADEVARRIRVRPSTIRLWVQEGIIPAIRVNGKVIRFDMDEVVQALKDRRMGDADNVA